MTAADIEILDSQIHVWGANTPERPWISKYAFAKPHGPAELTAEMVIAELDRAGVAGGILVPPSFEGDRNDLALAAVDQFPERFRVMGRFDVSDPANRDSILEAQRLPGMLGVRLTFNAQAAEWLRDPATAWFWDFAAQAGIPVSGFPNHQQDLESMHDIARRHPKLRLSIDHLGTSVNPQYFDSLEPILNLQPLSELPNVAVKVSALPNSFPTTYSPEVVRKVVDLLLDWFGPDRMFWGSDYTRAPAQLSDYAQTVRTFREGTEHLDVAVARRVMGGALRDWFGWQD